ncbi:hypothetical protein B0T25DRAFT_598920 [Lasiosphaeria hispida]|uniref:LysM domain-containing protein n=1 Tax=Lasiosphaeria hispida TaxID=260671 RepID=A0AAJ0HX98_9PEZI|nr:hypothetical protein B0T25DRAFT_598920 [Lasiosphaeria hispida]
MSKSSPSPGVQNGTFSNANSALPSNSTSLVSRLFRARPLPKRATCRYVEVVSGDTCSTLTTKCSIPAADLYKFNPPSDLCAGLMPGDYICCLAGDPYTKPKPPAPKPWTISPDQLAIAISDIRSAAPATVPPRSRNCRVTGGHPDSSWN